MNNCLTTFSKFPAYVTLFTKVYIALQTITTAVSTHVIKWT